MPASLVRSHHVPNDAELAVIKEKVTSMDSAISELKTTVGRIKSIKKCRKYKHSLFSPIRKVPDEILSHIFSYLVDEIDICEEGGPIFDLKKVFLRWPNVVDSNAFLWRKFNVGTPSKVSVEATSLRIHKCLELSHIGPLSIKHCHKGIPHGEYFQLCLDEGRAMVENLVLRDINYWNCNLSRYTSWKMLKTLTISSLAHMFPGWDLFIALSSMESLEDLTLEDIDSGLISPLTERVHLRSLTSLHLQNIKNCIYDGAIKMVCAPSLSKLRIIEPFDESHALEIIQEVIQTSKCSLQSLQLDVDATPNNIVSFLEEVSDIKSLSLVESSISEHVLRSIPTTLLYLDILELDLQMYCESIDTIVSCLRAAMMHYKTRLSRPLLEVRCAVAEWQADCYDEILKDLVNYGRDEMETHVTVAEYPDSVILGTTDSESGSEVESMSESESEYE